MTAPIHAATVRALYRRILTLHKRLPPQMKAIGDEYTRSEFRRHKDVEHEEAYVFIKEWTVYADMIDMQTRDKTEKTIGADLGEDRIGDFRNEQLGQLFELHKETTKPSHFPKEDIS